MIVLPFIAYNLINSKNNKEVLSEKNVNSLAAPSADPSPNPDPSSSPSPRYIPSKSSYTIAIIGDSMVDTMGENLEYLTKSLKAQYPQTAFKLFNYGIGGENVEKGLLRFDKPLIYKERNFSALSSLKADVIIVGSFAYNPFSPHDRQKHYTLLSQLVEKAVNANADVYLLAEIAPLGSNFGQGPNGINWPNDLALNQAAHIVQQLENVLNLANSKNLPLINAYLESQVNGKYGSGVYTDANDGIHPSVQGHVLMANLIARTLKLK